MADATAYVCANPTAWVTCAAVAGALTLAAGGSILDGLQAMAFAAAQVHIWGQVGAHLGQAVQAGLLEAGSAHFLAVKSAVHGVVGGALSVAQGGSFLSGFAANAVGAGFSQVSLQVSNATNSILAGAAVSAAGGGLAAELTGGKFANGAVTAAFAFVYNTCRSTDCVGRNNWLAAGWGESFDKSRWEPVGRIDDYSSSLTVNAGERIAVEASSMAYPPTNQFWFSVYATPMGQDGNPLPSLASPSWFKEVWYSSGFTGAGSPNRFVIEASAPGPSHQWTITLPPQQGAHDNAMYNTLKVYKERDLGP
ncbi:hypothetical protein [Rhodoligotrophos defluvii]|uniref:hypothetical protein n=1 Tax=Rhodoligotrophos defluvii TaxID=2561934 RepID=UPI0010C9FE61|nr:hypothetical protein [Rhodoligotrophos defluvii]